MNPCNEPWCAESLRLRFFSTRSILFVTDYAGLNEERKTAWLIFLKRGYPSKRIVWS